MTVGTRRISPFEPVRAYFKGLTQQNVLLWNPASELELQRTQRRLPKHVLSESEVEQILALPDVKDVFGLRDRALLETLYSTGMRRKELIGLGLFDIDSERGNATDPKGTGPGDLLRCLLGGGTLAGCLGDEGDRFCNGPLGYLCDPPEPPTDPGKCWEHCPPCEGDLPEPEYHYDHPHGSYNDHWHLLQVQSRSAELQM